MFTNSFYFQSGHSSVAEFGRQVVPNWPAAANDLSQNILLQRGTMQTHRSGDLGVRRPESAMSWQSSTR